MVLMLTLAACSSPPPIDYDLGIVWKDADGSIADGVTGAPNGPLLYEDHAGLFWHINAGTAIVSVAIPINGTFGTYPAYSSGDCTGTQYVQSVSGEGDFPAPRLTFSAPGDAAIHVRPDDLQPVEFTWCSIITSAGCKHTAFGPSMMDCDPGTSLGLPTAKLLPSPPLSIPVVPFVAPLHPELM